MFKSEEEPFRAVWWLDFCSPIQIIHQYKVLLFVVYIGFGLLVYWPKIICFLWLVTAGCNLLLPFIFYSFWPEEEEETQEATISPPCAKRLAWMLQISSNKVVTQIKISFVLLIRATVTTRSADLSFGQSLQRSCIETQLTRPPTEQYHNVSSVWAAGILQTDCSSSSAFALVRMFPVGSEPNGKHSVWPTQVTY